MDIPDLMSSDEIVAGLNTEILGKRVISYAQTGSTNDMALSMAAAGAQEGTLVVAESQTKGRGRRDRKWLAPMGTSILASLILRPDVMMAQEVQSITVTCASAIAQAIHNVANIPALIKWPNDVVIGERKVSGILTEARIKSRLVVYLVVGMGITVNIESENLPSEIADIATSLSIESGHNVSRIKLLQEILHQLEWRYIAIKERRPTALIAEWRNLLDTIGRQVQITLPRQIIRGRAVDIDEAGALLVKKDDGSIQRITADMNFQLKT